jgi:small subunit ribosomal protein S4
MPCGTAASSGISNRAQRASPASHQAAPAEAGALTHRGAGSPFDFTGSLTIFHPLFRERGHRAPASARPLAQMALSGQQQPKPDRHDMSKREESKYKINRRLGVNLWGRAKSPLNRREYGPGQHGQRRKKPSDYGTQLMAKQKLKGYYANLGERQFRKLYEEAVRRRGDTGENLIELLERRLDACVYRMKLAPTPFAARQIVNHGHVLVNGKRVNIASYQLRDGDMIELREKAKQMALVLEAAQSSERDIPEYVEIDHDRMRGRFVRAPKLADVPYPVTMEPNLVIEYYSR